MVNAMMKILMLWIVGLAPVLSADGPWVALFDGKSLAAWTSDNGGPPGDGWKVGDGVLHRAGGGGNLVSKDEFTDFELEFEWKISPKGNSGLKYRLRKTPAGWLGAEYQLIDDGGHPDAKDADRRTASLYDVAAAPADKELKPVGEWNHSRVVVKGKRIEHWLNGKMVIGIEVGSPEWEAGKKASKFSKVEGFAEPGPGRIQLQDHGDGVWFRGIRIRKL